MKTRLLARHGQRMMQIPEHFDEEMLNAIELPPNYPDHPLLRRDWYSYQRSVEVVDQRVGVMLDQLRAEGVEHGLVSLVDLTPSMLLVAGLPIPTWMEGEPLLGSDYPQRDHLYAARDRCGDAMDRIRAMIREDSLLVRNFHPELSRLNGSSYKEDSYPGMPLRRVLHDTGKLDPFPSTWLAPRRPEVEFYDLKSDPVGLYHIADDASQPSIVDRQRNVLDAWIKPSNDQGRHSDPSTEPTLAEIQKSKRADCHRTWQKR